MAPGAGFYLAQVRIEDPVFLTPDDVLFLQTQIVDIECQMTQFKKEALEHLKESSQVTAIEHRQEAMHTRILLLKNVLAPIRHIPFDILFLIFELVCCSTSKILDAMHSATIISQVCIAWSKAAHATSRIWTRLSLSFKLNPRSFLGDFSWVKAWLTRSRGRPLKVLIELVPEIRPDEVPIHKLTQLVESIAPFSCQIQTMTVLGDPDTYRPLFRLPPSSFLMLEEICISLVRGSDSKKTATLLKGPKLRRVTIGEPFCHDSSEPSVLESFALAEEQLTMLVIRGPKFQSDRAVYLDVLQRCKALEHLTIYLSLPLPSAQPFLGFHEGTSVSLPGLRTLDVTCHQVTGSGVNLLQCLTCPRLEGLVLSWQGQNLLELVLDVTNFQSRSAVALLVLTLDLTGIGQISGQHSHFITGQIVNLLTIFPTVTRFKLLSKVYDVDHLIQAMIWNGDESQPKLLPKLRILEFVQREATSDQHSTSHLEAMVSSRCAANGSEGRLEALFLYGSQFGEDSVRIQERKLGIELHYNSYA
ncbi:hypothetical protein GYMLUDRAFT_65383 [Collybiopsis luxurians FD-317 M1]|uniref:F-box domain-containing protein n=1 Tax=Collybiopsis luxurians FD-317 M1 TaxID=944289 RepID=A0A0D0B7T6_9AGAR|nr:hypothetical protein GYMLUDRAFT_65383 [Collybiopsis luxurians FD-317 M1]